MGEDQGALYPETSMSKRPPTVVPDDELEYYKELARLWEIACHDFRAYTSEFFEDPETYKEAVAFSAQRPQGEEPT